MELNKIYQGDSLEVLKTFPDESINCVMTSPPYWALRDYGISGQLGLEPTFNEYITKLCDIFDEVKRVLRKDGTCWVNLGDTYYSISGGKYLNDNISSAEKNIKKGIVDTNKFRNGKELQQKNLCNIPSRFSIAMQDRGWILRNRIIWHKPNCMPSSIKDRFTVDFEDIFFFVKNKKYWFETQYEPVQKSSIQRMGRKWCGSKENRLNVDGCLSQKIKPEERMDKDRWLQKISPNTDRPNSPHYRGDYTNDYQEYGRNKRSVWLISVASFSEAHFATYPEELCQTPIKAGCPINGIVLDPFCGAGTTGLVALKLNRKFIGIELNPKYIEIANKRLDCWLNQQRLD